MRKLLIIAVFALAGIDANAKPGCQSFNNRDDKVTIVFTDEKAGSTYSVSDVKLIPGWWGKEYNATSVSVYNNNGKATVTLTFPHLTRFSNPKVVMRVNGRKTTLKVCQ